MTVDVAKKAADLTTDAAKATVHAAEDAAKTVGRPSSLIRGTLSPGTPLHARSRGPRRPAPLAWLTRFRSFALFMRQRVALFCARLDQTNSRTNPPGVRG